MKNIFFLNHKQKQCGVYQYGIRSFSILRQSKEFNFFYYEVDSKEDFFEAVDAYSPCGIIYNFHISTMGWINSDIISSLPNIVHYGIFHEGNQIESVAFDYLLLTDSTQLDSDKSFSIPRPLFEGIYFKKDSPSIPTIGSFGFGFFNKGFERLCSLVNEQFDEAIIKLHIPFSFYGDEHGHSSMAIISNCKSLIKKSGIELIYTNNFLSDSQLLDFLSGNTINAFLYDQMPNRGLSSVIDYALSVDVPIAISNTHMFRHILDADPSITIENRTLNEIIESGTSPILKFKDKWSNSNFLNKYHLILNRTIKQ